MAAPQLPPPDYFAELLKKRLAECGGAINTRADLYALLLGTAPAPVKTADATEEENR